MRPKREASPPGLFCSPSIFTSVYVVCHLNVPWQDPGNERKRLYKVFDKITDSAGTKTSTGHCLKGSANVSSNKAMRSSLAAVLTVKQSACIDPMYEQLAIEDGRVDGRDGGGPTRRDQQERRPKKELTDSQKKQLAFDKNMKENLSYYR